MIAPSDGETDGKRKVNLLGSYKLEKVLVTYVLRVCSHNGFPMQITMWIPRRNISLL